ncbi:cystinosin homolog isoform X2 [Lathyrus oleraceus]|uniref:Cystinosin homolog n=1 Tax=Pisum sativum TaxID=3888 RepID=A0A9D5BGR4_PEA|nr:cystinosin homolog isoform X2 [Pisum sativum]KAI5443362.1 hypothetical protein KIW84_012135 [Pisum sativum]
METSWNSDILKVEYSVFGWIAFVAWSTSFYPQLFMNFSRKSVVGLNFNYLLLNNTKQSLYLIYNASLYFSSTLQFQYHKKYGFDQRGNQSISKITMGIITMVWVTAGVCFFIAFPSNSWLWLVTIFNTMQVLLASIKYIPQAVMNFMLKSTDGFCIGNVFLDFIGGISNVAQMVTQSIDQNSLVNFYGNLGKVLLSLVTLFFDILFMFQRFVLYPSNKTSLIPLSKLNDKVNEPLIKSLNQPLATNLHVAENV